MSIVGNAGICNDFSNNSSTSSGKWEEKLIRRSRTKKGRSSTGRDKTISAASF
jgi:hypothetical protein